MIVSHAWGFLPLKGALLVFWGSLFLFYSTPGEVFWLISFGKSLSITTFFLLEEECSARTLRSTGPSEEGFLEHTGVESVYDSEIQLENSSGWKI